MNNAKGINKLILCALVVVIVLFMFTVNPATAEASSTGTVSTTALNIRSGPGVNYTSLGLLSINKEVTILDTVRGEDGDDWYYITYSSVKGYVSSKFIIVNTDVEYVYDGDFEDYMTKQGFPESYKPYLRELHARYPLWVFKASKTGLDWNDAIDRESTPGTTLVASSSNSSWKSMEKGAYSFESGNYIQYDSGGWVTASRPIIEYYMDPRNFLTQTGIFQFLTHGYDENTQTIDGLQKVLTGTFMEGEFPEPEYATYADVLMTAGREAGVNPYVLASMITVEQGSKGTGSCISGTVSGYEGYYNFFNIGAYKTSTMSAVTRGLWYASQSGAYNRPWDSRYKSILGGAMFYGANYVSNNKNTLYFKKFNVMNGLGSVGTGQYMTNVQGAESEAAALRKGYAAVLDSPMTFLIPVYNNMSSQASPLPSSGNNNCYLASLNVSGYTITPEFDKYTTEYELVVDKSVTAVNVEAAASSSSAEITGTGLIKLTSDTANVVIKVTSSSGMTKKYTVTISKKNGGQSSSLEPTVKSSIYNFGDYLTGVKPGTGVSKFTSGIDVNNGTLVVKNKSGSKVTSGNIGTGMTVEICDLSGKTVVSYTVMIKGDLNGDGKINSADPLVLQKHIVGSKAISGVYLAAADINGDTRTNSLDVLYIQKHIVGSYTIDN